MLWAPRSPPTIASSFLDINSVAATILGSRFCLVLVFHRKTYIFHCNCDVESFCCESRPRSYSTPLWRLVLLWSELEPPHIHRRFIFICNFRLRIYPFLLVFFDSMREKVFLARSIELCLVDNQRSSSVIRSPDRQHRVLHQSNLSYLSEDRASATSQWETREYQFLDTMFSFRIFVWCFTSWRINKFNIFLLRLNIAEPPLLLGKHKLQLFDMVS
jgi:hypothetical protein